MFRARLDTIYFFGGGGEGAGIGAGRVGGLGIGGAGAVPGPGGRMALCCFVGAGATPMWSSARIRLSLDMIGLLVADS